MNHDFIIVIPARLESSRLTHKVLVDIAGKSMLERVYQQACLSAASKVYIATDDQKVADLAQSFNADVCMTRTEHRSGTERLSEAVQQLGYPADTLIVNVQGDEPLIDPRNINQVARLLSESKGADMATLMTSLSAPNELYNPHTVKVVTDANGRALYFSRATIPWWRSEFDGKTPDILPSDMPYPVKRHIGIYAYRAAFLHHFVALPASPLEQMEQLEQLRALWHGYHIQLADTLAPCFGGIDTPEDLAKIRAYMALIS